MIVSATLTPLVTLTPLAILTPITALILLTSIPLATTTTCVCLQQYATDLHNPLYMTHFPHEPNTFLIVEQRGVVLRFDGPNQPRDTPFLDLTHKVTSSNTFGEERGLLGLALAPDFATSGHVFTYQIVTIDGKEHAEVTRYGGGRGEVVILRVEQVTPHRNGGMLLFGDDGLLYVFVGDGGSKDSAQDMSSHLGKVLRLNISHASPPLNYSIPQSNPYPNHVTTLPEIYASGFMNPWRCSVDAGHAQTGSGAGRVFCSDTGETDYDEINIIEKGGNYGWALKEGNTCREGVSQCSNIANEKSAIYVYDHTGRPASLVGGYVYRGSGIPALSGHYVFGDVMGASVMALKHNSSSDTWAKHDVTICPANQCPCNARATPNQFLLAFAQDEDHELFVLMVNALQPNEQTGQVFKLVSPISDAVCDPISTSPPSSASILSSFRHCVLTLALIVTVQWCVSWL